LPVLKTQVSNFVSFILIAGNWKINFHSGTDKIH